MSLNSLALLMLFSLSSPQSVSRDSCVIDATDGTDATLGAFWVTGCRIIIIRSVFVCCVSWKAMRHTFSHSSVVCIQCFAVRLQSLVILALQGSTHSNRLLVHSIHPNADDFLKALLVAPVSSSVLRAKSVPHDWPLLPQHYLQYCIRY